MATYRSMHQMQSNARLGEAPRTQVASHIQMLEVQIRKRSNRRLGAERLPARNRGHLPVTKWRHVQICVECGKTKKMENPAIRNQNQTTTRWPCRIALRTQCSYDGTCNSRTVLTGWLPEGYLPVTDGQHLTTNRQSP